jgi:hypothetical protein
MKKSSIFRLLFVGVIVLFVMACSIPSLRPRKTTTAPTSMPIATVAAATIQPTRIAATAAPSQTPIRSITEIKSSTPTLVVRAPTSPAVTDAPKSGSDDFPLPKDAKNVITMADTIVFQTGMNLKDCIAFYRDAYAKQGLKERSLLTVTSDITFSMVFDGAKDGKSVVVQGVDMGGGLTTVTIRYEKV